jgi:hypothetical protein
VSVLDLKWETKCASCSKQLEEKMLQKLEEDVVMAEDNIDPTA